MTQPAQQYHVVNGTYYHASTRPEVVRVLESVRLSGRRIRISLGDLATGRDWHEEHGVEGYVGRSVGPVKVPLLIHNRRSLGGPAMLDRCIIRIKRTGQGGRVLYEHPDYT